MKPRVGPTFRIKLAFQRGKFLVTSRNNRFSFSDEAARGFEERLDKVASARATAMLRGRLKKKKTRKEDAMVNEAREIYKQFCFRLLVGSGERPHRFIETPEFEAAKKQADVEFFIRLGRQIDKPEPLFDKIDLTIMAFDGPGVSFQGSPIPALRSLTNAAGAQLVTILLQREGNPINEGMYKKRRQRLFLQIGTGEQIPVPDKVAVISLDRLRNDAQAPATTKA